MKKEREEFRKLLRQIRLACGYSQGAVAAGAGCEPIDLHLL
ncbi:hypothetical protein [Neglectibacter caecimuris]|nr:hypothetical protein [Neglectibacter sp. M00184]